jgi:NAD(P)H-dependent flavin oxidoreductase YrpB (nitropropane dioxygenase family)
LLDAGAEPMLQEYVGELDLDREFMPSGQVVGAIDSILSAGDVVKEMVTLAASTLDGLTRFRSKL